MCALDARFLPLASGTAVDSWTDRSRSGNSPSATSTVRPTFTVNQIGGQPAVVFDGSNDKLDFALAIVSLSFSFVCAMKYTSENVIGFVLGQWASAQDGRSALAQNQASNGSAEPNKLNFFNSSQTSGAGSWGFCLEVSTASPLVASFTQTSGTENFKNYYNGANVDSCTISAQYTGVNTALGALSAAQTGTFDGGIGCASMFQTSIAPSLRKRLEHAAAFSFKIACN